MYYNITNGSLQTRSLTLPACLPAYCPACLPICLPIVTCVVVCILHFKLYIHVCHALSCIVIVIVIVIEILYLALSLSLLLVWLWLLQLLWSHCNCHCYCYTIKYCCDAGPDVRLVAIRGCSPSRLLYMYTGRLPTYMPTTSSDV